MDSEFPVDGPTEQEVFSGPLTERIVHKNFKARKEAYEELKQAFAAQQVPEADFTEFFRKMSVEVNAIALDTALDFFLVYFDKYDAFSLPLQLTLFRHSFQIPH